MATRVFISDPGAHPGTDFVAAVGCVHLEQSWVALEPVGQKSTEVTVPTARRDQVRAVRAA
ncbi:hypothetical protein [Nocardia mikamii]|uniref:hypothetical protein n=1 Tax=Nocardia mikamii TaxID=508464 RepID=UPI00157DE14A|nr:hypothetical protein [Nocardia mikamii]